jgi:hypothetical protein
MEVQGGGDRGNAQPLALALLPAAGFTKEVKGRPRSLRLPGDIRVANGRVFGEG